MNQPVKKLIEGYKPYTIPVVLKAIAGGLSHLAKSNHSTRTDMEGGQKMTAHLDSQKPTLMHHVPDVKRTAEWYRDNLGFEIGPHEYGTFVEMLLDGKYMFHLVPAPGPVTPYPYSIFSFTSLDIEMTHSVLRERGVKAEPIQWFPDYSSFTFKDVDGNEVSITQNFEIRLKEVGELHLVGYRLTLPEGTNRVAVIQEAARQLRERVAEISSTLDTFFMIGAYLPSNSDYWVGLQVSQIESIPEGMESVTLPAQHYAVKWHYGLRSDVQHTYERMSELLEQAGITLDTNAWTVEMTRNWGSKPEEEELEMDLYLAVK